MPEPFTYDPLTPLGRLRLNLTDTNRDSAVFSDVELNMFLAECGGDVDCATYKALRVLKAHAAIRGEADRVAAIDEVMDTLPVLDGIPFAVSSYPAPWPMDEAFEEPIAAVQGGDVDLSAYALKTEAGGPWVDYRFDFTPINIDQAEFDTEVQIDATTVFVGIGGALTTAGGLITINEAIPNPASLTVALNVTTNAAPGQAEAGGLIRGQYRETPIAPWTFTGPGVHFEVDEQDEDEIVLPSVIGSLFAIAGAQLRFIIVVSDAETGAGIQVQLTAGRIVLGAQGAITQ